MMKRGRPKGRSRDTRSFGPLGDLIRSKRLARGLGLAEVAKACNCSVQFISNIEHGRAPLPWDKSEHLSRFLEIPLEDLQAANLAVRADFKSFIVTTRPAGKKVGKAAVVESGNGVTDTASLVALTAKDPQLLQLLQRYQSASPSTRKKFYQNAKRFLS